MKTVDVFKWGWKQLKNISLDFSLMKKFFRCGIYIDTYCCCCLVAKSCLTVCDSMDSSLPGSSVHGISQARILEWIAISFSRRLLDSGIEPAFLALQVNSLLLGKEFFTREARVCVYVCACVCVYTHKHLNITFAINKYEIYTISENASICRKKNVASY